MDTRSCAHHTCDQEFTPNNGKQRYCGNLCRHAAYRQTPKGAETVRRSNKRWQQANLDKAAAYVKRWREANPDKEKAKAELWRAANPEYMKEYHQNRYYNQTVPRGQRLQERLDNLFRSQAALDPARLPQLASRVLEWSPKGYSSVVAYAKHPLGPIERDWLYYAEMSPEEAVVVYARED